MSANFRLLLIWTLLLSVVYGLTWPTHVLIADEVAYFDDALRWLGRASPCESSTWSGYSPGTSLVAAGFIGLTGHPRAGFGVGLFAWFTGIWLTAWSLWRWRRPVHWALYLALFLPGVVLSRVLMSDLLSWSLSAAFLCAYGGYGQQRQGAFIGGLCAGTALLFRETNAVWAIPFLIGALWRPTYRASWLWAGFLAGLIGRMLWAKLCFDHFGYIRDPGIGFSLAYAPKNIILYCLVLMVLCPGGLFFLRNKKVPFWPEIILAVVAVLGLYSTYGYDALAKSGGIKGLVLQGRYVLPLIPFLAFAGAFSKVAEEIPRWATVFALCFTGFLFVGVQLIGWFYNNQQNAMTQMLLQLPTDKHWSLSYDESRKYLNALHALTCLLPLRTDGMPDEAFYVHLFTREDSADWRKKNAENSAVLEHIRSQRSLLLIDERISLDGTRLRIWRVGAVRRR
ncbi:MAG: hypothetical protein NZM43_13130 [Saprospiraceae bacterium]|nr:hypothetical protein [Saprospiraceae bacterium]MDW8485257.1 hypothetical protein [Saprospiraceae bacterium]